MLKEHLTKAIELHTGRRVVDLKIHPDPKVTDTYALRVTMGGEGPETLDFLIIGSCMRTPLALATLDEVADALEDTMYATWPPEEGPTKFAVRFHLL